MFDLKLLGHKLERYRGQFQVSIPELSEVTGIEEESLVAYENGQQQPTGDEILILADFYKCDYKFFISSDRVAPFEQTDTLFRRHGDEFSKSDRWAIQEFLFLSECESFLTDALERAPYQEFSFTKQGTFYKAHGEQAAQTLRRKLGYADNEIPMDVYKDFRAIGIHVFRRQLENSSISGLFIKHPVAGKCILVNYGEDVYRQRFTVAHEAAHAILDDNEEVVVSFTGWQKGDLVEVRANTFSSNYLMPRSFLRSIPNPHEWDLDKATLWSNKLKVSTEALAYALAQADLIDKRMVQRIKSVRVSKEAKTDPELPTNLSPNVYERKKKSLKRGLSTYYVRLCLEAYRRSVISAARVAEMLLIDEVELRELLALYGESLKHGS